VPEVALHPREVAAHGRRQTGILCAEKRGDLGQRQPHLPKCEDAIQPPDILFGIDAVAGLRALRWDEQTQLVVMM